MTTTERIRLHKKATMLLVYIGQIESGNYLLSRIDDRFCQSKKSDYEAEYSEIMLELQEPNVILAQYSNDLKATIVE